MSNWGSGKELEKDVFYNEAEGTLTLYGVKYSLEFFRKFTDGTYRVHKGDGVLVVEKLEEVK